MPILTIKLPDQKGEITHVLSGDRITIGRRPDNTIQIIDRTISGHHAELIAFNGHYRLHDLGSTNLTTVNGQPISDYHLHDVCQVSFGTVECHFSPETPAGQGEAELVPTRGELQYLRQENTELKNKLSALEKRIDILGSARLMTRETTQLGLTPEGARRLTSERDALRGENTTMKMDLENIRNDYAKLKRDRDAMRQAWETVRNELASTKMELAALRGQAPPADALVVSAAFADSSSAPNGDPLKPLDSPVASDTHRLMATVLINAPPLLNALNNATEALKLAPDSTDAKNETARAAKAFAGALEGLNGHPFQLLGSELSSLAVEACHRSEPVPPGTLETLDNAVRAITTFLDPQNVRKAAELPRPRVLCVDDDRDLLETMAITLRSASYELITATDATQALATLKARPFDLVILDIGLPEMDGHEVCRKVRNLSGCESIPIVFVTGNSSEADQVKAMDSGGTDFLAKPFQAADLALKARVWSCRSQLGLPSENALVS